jgi:hypothetical protein
MSLLESNSPLVIPWIRMRPFFVLAFRFHHTVLYIEMCLDLYITSLFAICRCRKVNTAAMYVS